MTYKSDAALIYEDSKVTRELQQLTALLQRSPNLVVHPRKGVPGLPSLPNPEGERYVRYDRVWSEDQGEYLLDTPLGLARALYGSDVGYDLSRYTPFYRIVKPRDDVELPKAQIPRVGDVVLDGVTRMATVFVEKDSGRPVSVYNVRLQEEDLTRGYRILEQVRQSLLEAGVPVLPARIWRRDSLEYPFAEEETEFSIASVSNGETVASVVGYAMDKRTREVIYLHMTGWKTSCRSIWASLNSSNGRLVHVHAPDGSNAAFGTHNYHTYSDVIDADMGIFRLMAVDRRATAFEVDAQAYLLVRRGEEEDEVDRLFAGRLNAVLSIPIQPKWGGVLRREGVEAELVRPIKADGDVAYAYALEPDEAWHELVEKLLRNGEFSI